MIRILVASPTERGAGYMSRVLDAFDDFEVVAVATDLQQVNRVIEFDPPDFVLLSQKFRGSRDSEVLMSLLDDKDIRWLELASRDPNAAPGTIPALTTAGLFEIDATTPAPMLARQIRSVCRNVRCPHAVTAQPRIQRPARHPMHDKIVLIGASTGGVDCLMQILENYGTDCPPTLIVQHTGNEFMSSLIHLLDRRCPVPVVAANDGQNLVRGQVAVAGDGLAHLALTAGHPVSCRSVASAPVSGHRPSVDALFHSAVPLAKQVVAVLLTGMGRDGATGMLELRKKGATTIAQDQASSVVYGMPRVAKDLGAVDHVMAMADIAKVLCGSLTLPVTRKGATL